MELRRAAEALVRSQSSPLAAFLVPSATSRWTSGRQLKSSTLSNRATQRTFASSSRRFVVLPPRTPSAAPSAPREEGQRSEPTSSAYPPTKTPRPWNPHANDDSIERITEALWSLPSGNGSSWSEDAEKSPKNGTSGDELPSSKKSAPASLFDDIKFDPTRGKSGNESLWSLPSSSRQNMEKTLNMGTSADELMRALHLHQKKTSTASMFDDMKFPDLIGGEAGSHSPLNDIQGAARLFSPRPERIAMKLNPTTGRSVVLRPGMDIGRGLKILEMSCSRNKIRYQSNLQKFHERAGLKKKRLRRSRWRMRFMEGFKATVARVTQLKKQGW